MRSWNSVLRLRTSSSNGSCFESVIFDDEFTPKRVSIAQTIRSQSSNALHRIDNRRSNHDDLRTLLLSYTNYNIHKCYVRMLVLDYNETEKGPNRKIVGSVMSRSCLCMSMKSKRWWISLPVWVVCHFTHITRTQSVRYHHASNKRRNNLNNGIARSTSHKSVRLV